jgi:hypothetical protein
LPFQVQFKFLNIHPYKPFFATMQLQLSMLSTALFASVAYCGTMTFLPSGSNCVLALSDYYSCSETSTPIGVYNSAKNSCSGKWFRQLITSTWLPRRFCQ